MGSLRVVAALVLVAYALAHRRDDLASPATFPGTLVVAGVLLVMAAVQMRTPWSRRVSLIGFVADIVCVTAVLFLHASDPANALYTATIVVAAEGALVIGPTGPLLAWGATGVGYLGAQIWADVRYGTAAAPATSLVRLAAGFGVAALLRALIERITAQERRYRDLVEGLDAIVWEADARDGGISFAGGALERILGYHPARWMAPDAWAEWIHPDDRARLSRIRAEVADGEGDRQVEYRASRKDGRMVWLRDSLTLARRPGGAGILRGLTVDVTERRLAEEAARESEQRLFRLLSTLPVGVFVLASDGTPYFVNDQARELLGRDIDTEVGPDELTTAYRAYVRGTDIPYPPERTPIVRALGGEVAHIDDMEVRRPDGAVPLEVWGAPILDSEGRLAYAIAAFIDVSDRIAAQRNLAEVNLRFELLLSSAGDGIYGLDAAGRVTLVNPAAAAMLGFRPDELVGRSMHDAVHHSRPDGTPYPVEECPVAIAVAEGRQVSGRDVLWRSDGTSFPAEFTAAPIERDGRAAGAVVIIRDVTERHEVDRMKDEFVSMVSHELRTPLTSIRGALGLLASGLVPPTERRSKEMLDIAVSNTDRLVRLINDILDLERMQTGRVALELAAVSARALVEETVAALEGVAGPAGVALEADAGDGMVWADHDRIVQALMNLVGNAVKFSPQGGTVEVSARSSGDEVLFAVRDEGRGIHPDQQDRIFERFAQVDASDAREKGGTGLGLAIVKEIVERHGGRVWVESEPGRGATFSFTVPAVPAGTGGAVEPPDSAGVILVVDDDPAIVDLLRTLLSDQGFAVLGASSGEEALATARSRRVDVVVLDLLMPGMSGWQLLEHLRAEVGDVPAIVLSALSLAEAGRAPGTPAEVDAFLTKPISEPELLDAISNVARPRRGAPRALLVEDDQDLAEVLTALLESRAVDVLHAPTASAAIRLARRFPPDVVILDLALPGAHGSTVVQALRDDEELRTVPVVVYTGLDVDDEERERLRSGTTVFLTKTKVTPEQLERRVADLLGRMAADPGGGAVGETTEVGG